ncbi:hypothetical protein SAMN05444372_101300 [Flavobacterium micromati]|uniref:Tetratricopeptide repeat-containing protein n=1 Tax=Flavobacterium micromati TaxID=229205 RepID=A0A1M5FU91_9FLAO|nr:hypothetical protein [Flavobacterium micromati]SHF95120.1 hypothetical protein SAMN05444372_101300 [Flavobacterium micromati]
MKKSLLLAIFFLILAVADAQTKTKQNEKVKTAQSQMNKAMEVAMKDMSEEEKTEMRKMMKEVMPEMAKKPGSDVISFTDNKKLVPAKDVARTSSLSKKPFTDEDVTANTALLYSKLMAKIPMSEKILLSGVMAKASTGSLLMEAATISFIQGHNNVAIGLAIKAVQEEPKTSIYQNNLAAILSQSGYPEKAIPYLQKLEVQFPSNSTVLHNLGYAWLQLGDVDTASKFFGFAAARNPSNPETALCRGVIEELRGDPKKAADHYVEAFEQAPNPFTENMAKNVNAENRLDKIDFNKLKSRISIYEYFKKDWIKITVLVDDVSAYESNRSIQNGFSEMFTRLEDKIDVMSEASNAEVEALADQGETEFAQVMMKESQKGYSMISLPAVYIQKILMFHMWNWQQDYVIEYSDLLDEIQKQKQLMTTYGENDKCADYDRKNNEFLRYANPLIRQFHATKIEEARVWLNAFCTWGWYIAGNPKNTVLTQCISWTSFLTKMYENAVHDQYTFAQTCVNQNGDGVTYMEMPTIPNFTCPAIVSIPFGLDELRLSADAANFDDNSWGIQKAVGSRHRNLTLGYGTDKNYITEPGKYGNPFTKTGNGSITPPGMGINDLVPLSKVLDDLNPLDPALLDTDKKLSSKRIRDAAMARQLLNEMNKTECPGKLPPKKSRKEKFEFGVGKIELLEWSEDLNAWVDDKGELMYDKDFKTFGKLELSLGELQLLEWNEDYNAWVNDKGKLMYDKNGKTFEKFAIGVGEIEFEEIQTSGLQTVINNGMEAVGTVTDFIKGLFN